MDFIKSLDTLNTVVSSNGFDVYSGDVLERKQLASFGLLKELKDHSVICTVVIEGVMYPMSVVLYGTANSFGYSENELLTLLTGALEKAYKGPEDILIIHRTVAPLTLRSDGDNLVIFSDINHRLVTFTTTPNTYSSPYILPEHSGEWYLLHTVLDTPGIGNVIGNIVVEDYVCCLIKSIFTQADYQYIPFEKTQDNVTLQFH